MLPHATIERFIHAHELPPGFTTLIDEHFQPLAEWLQARSNGRNSLLVGISGAQGTGKSTLAEFLALTLGEAGLATAVLSIDDFYLTAAERRDLAGRVHALLQTRGVPGTHDLALLMRTLGALRALGGNESLRLPTFDKATDDRTDPVRWQVQTGAPDVIILEGWCIGCRPEPADALAIPLNALERDHDPDGRWRHYVNEQLAGPYSPLFAALDRLIFLKVPNFDTVFRWRAEQEQKLSERAPPDAAGVMSPAEVRRFIQHFERITRANLALLSGTADAVLELDDQHGCPRHYFNHGDAGT